MRRVWIVGLLLVVVAAGAAAWLFYRPAPRASAANISEQAAASMEQKLARVVAHGAGSETGQLVTVLTEEEVNSYFRLRMREKIPAGVYDVWFTLRKDQPSGRCVVDFEEVKRASKRPVNSIVNQLLTGRKPVEVTARFTSADGTGLFHLEEVSMGSMRLSGYLLDLVVRHFVQPRYPSAAIDRPFTLPQSIDRLVIEDGRAVIHQK